MTSATGITLEEAQDMYRKYMNAEILVLSNQRYKITDRELERAELKDIVAGKIQWERICKELAGVSKRRTVSVNPVNI